MLMNFFLKFQFSYCPLVWMCHSCTIKIKINHLHKIFLRIIYKDKVSSFKELLEIDGSVPSIWDIQTLATEMVKVQNIAARPIFTAILYKRNINYQLRHTLHFSVSPVRSVYNETESLSFLGPKIWNIVPTDLKDVKTSGAFKSRIKKQWPKNCPCRLCKRYLPNIGLLDQSESIGDLAYW